MLRHQHVKDLQAFNLSGSYLEKTPITAPSVQSLNNQPYIKHEIIIQDLSLLLSLQTNISLPDVYQYFFESIQPAGSNFPLAFHSEPPGHVDKVSDFSSCHSPNAAKRNGEQKTRTLEVRARG